MASLTSLQKRYDRCIENDDFYGAEQACRMMYHRLTQSKSATPQDIERARSIMQAASITLLQKHQIQAGAALGLLVVKHSEDHNISVSDKSVASLRQIAGAFNLPPDSDESAIHELKREKLRFLKASVAWSARKDCAGFKNGHAGLNTLAACAAAESDDGDLAHRLFVHSDDPNAFAAFLHKYAATETLKSERALVLTRAILRYLLSENVKDAMVLRIAFARLSGWKSVEGTVGSPSERDMEAPPLANFCELIVKLCQLEPAAAPLYTKVVSTYDSELRRDETIPPMVTTLGAQYFGIQPPPPSGLGGMMNSMLRGLMST